MLRYMHRQGIQLIAVIQAPFLMRLRDLSPGNVFQSRLSGRPGKGIKKKGLKLLILWALSEYSGRGATSKVVIQKMGKGEKDR